MVYLFESELLDNQAVFFAMTNIFGIGKSQSSIACKKLGFSKNLKIKNLSKDQLDVLVLTINSLNLILSSDLKKLRSLKLKKLISIKSSRGFRRMRGLPVRGQRTHTNARTSRKKK